MDNGPVGRLRYRISVSAHITVPDRLRYLFYSKNYVAPGDYEATVDVRRIEQERDVQSLTSLFPGKVTLKVIRTIIE
jgi:hypothetical protein